MTAIEPGVLLEGKYRIRELLAGDGETTVFRAEHTGIAREVRLKTLSGDVSPDSAATRRLLREAKAAGSVAHQNVQSVLDSGIDQRGLPFVVFEALSGMTLREWMTQEGSMRSEDDVTALMLPLLEGLSAVHEGGVVHRSVSPSSIRVEVLRGGGMHVKLTDFSQAILLGEPAASPGPLPKRELPEARYLPPEQAARRPPWPGWDVYSAGVVFRELLTDPRHDTFFGNALAERVITGATAVAEEERYPNARVMLEAAFVIQRGENYLSTIPAPDVESQGPLEQDLRFLKLRRDTNHDRTAPGLGEGRVRLVLVLLVIEWLYKTFGEARWRDFAARVPEINQLLPGGGNTEAHRKLGIEVGILAQLLALVDEEEGGGDLGYVAQLGDQISERAIVRLLPDSPRALAPGQVAVLFPPLWRAITRQGKATVLERSATAATVAVENQVEPALEVTSLVAGLLRGLLRRAGATGGEVQVTACEALGDRATVFRLSW